MPLDTKLRNEDLFDELDEEEQELDREFEVKKDSVLGRMCKEFEELLNGKTSSNDFIYHKMIIDITRNNLYTAKSIEKFSLISDFYQNHNLFEDFIGFYLSGCINNCKDNHIKIHTKHLDKKICRIGKKNDGKSIIIYGNVNNSVGEEMKSGSIEVFGDVGLFSGSSMGGGLIKIHGNAGHSVGFAMKGGEIHLNGDYISISRNKFGGNIYHKGRLIVKDGERV